MNRFFFGMVFIWGLVDMVDELSLGFYWYLVIFFWVGGFTLSPDGTWFVCTFLPLSTNRRFRFLECGGVLYLHLSTVCRHFLFPSTSYIYISPLRIIVDGSVGTSGDFAHFFPSF